MRNTFLIFGMFVLLPFNAMAQGDSILEFFDNIFNISGFIEDENKERLKRELKYFAQKADELIIVKKETTTFMLEHCNGNGSESKINTQIDLFNNKIKQSVKNLESIRENVMFESDYDIVVDTVYVAVQVPDSVEFEMNPGCYIKKDTNYLTEDYAPESYNMVAQMNLPVSQVVTDSVVVTNMYCPQVRTRNLSKESWKTVSFSGLIEGFQYSLNTKMRNIDYLLQNCEKKLILQERNRSIEVLQQMRDKALDLKKDME